MNNRVLIIGAGQAAAQTAMSLRQAKFEGEILILGSESHYPYQRPPLSKQLLQGSWQADRCLLRKAEYYDQHDITLQHGITVEDVDTAVSAVRTANGDVLSYDWLVICSGSELNRLDLPGCGLDGVQYLRTLDDAVQLQPRLQQGRRIVVVGGGYIGLEVAASARKNGCEVTVVEVLDGLMKRSALPEIARFLQQRHEREGVAVLLDTMVSGFGGEHALAAVHLQAQNSLDADVAVVGIGVKPAIGWLASCAVACGRGVLVDERCRTNIENVYAAGDCTEHVHVNYAGTRVLESVQNAIGQGRIVAAQITGTDKQYDEVPWFWSEQYDCRLQMAGLPGVDDEIVQRGDSRSGSFSLFSLSDGRPTGVQAINAAKDFMAGKLLIAKNANVDAARLARTEVDLKELL